METFVLYATYILSFANQVLFAAIVILAFSLLVYLLTHNPTSAVSRSFCALIGCVCIAYAGDLALSKVDSLQAAVPWLKVQWIGIAFVPAAYLHFSDALLRTTNSISRSRWLAVMAAYVLGLILLPLAFFTEWLVRDGVYSPAATQFTAGPLFWLFTAYFFAAVIGGAFNMLRARQRCLTTTSRRRMTYLALSFAAPALGVFPYLLVASMPTFLPLAGFLLILFVGNLGVAAMLIVMAYSVAYFDVFTPDRVIKHNLIHYLLRGPLVATAVIFLMLAMPKVPRILGLPRDMMLIVAVVSVIVLLQLLINLAKPAMDRLAYRQDRAEVSWIQQLDRRLLTTTDLQQALENVLTALCDVLRVRTGFVAELVGDGTARVVAYCGSLNATEACLQGLETWTPPHQAEGSGHGGDVLHFFPYNGFWLVPLRTKKRDALLGLLGVESRAASPNLREDEEEIISMLLSQAELALEDRRLQQGVFSALEQIIPEIEQVQRWRSAVRYSGSPRPTLETPADSPLSSPDFTQWVKDALSHYWGGPKLTQSPLLKLKVVQEALRENDGNPARALRAVLDRAIEGLRPEGERHMTRAEWILYNILDLKFVQGLQVRNIAGRLAMSESDLYRKQRVAIEQVARALADMEYKGAQGVEPDSAISTL
jgi:hypothetical protein